MFVNLEKIDFPQYKGCRQKFLNGNFIESVFWQVDKISLHPLNLSTGFILQKIMRKESCPVYSIEYFEAWKVDAGKVYSVGTDHNVQPRITLIDVFSSMPHDKWVDGFSQNTENFPFIPLAGRVGKSGLTEIDSNIYWIPLSSRLYNTINNFPFGGVDNANGLRSVYKIDFEHELPSFFQRHFSHEWDMTNSKLICNAICEINDSDFKKKPLLIDLKVKDFFQNQDQSFTNEVTEYLHIKYAFHE